MLHYCKVQLPIQEVCQMVGHSNLQNKRLDKSLVTHVELIVKEILQLNPKPWYGVLRRVKD